tara:strand:+ start:105 stop:323 length:219 start_codon:yes stop_codon:yes gene_type:complete
MASRMSQLHNAAELSLMKHGNCIWVPCPKCSERFPVSPEIYNQDQVAMHCPDCSHEFFNSQRTDNAINTGDS